MTSPESVIKYEVFSQIPQRLPVFAPKRFPGESPQSCLQIASFSPRIRDLVGQITQKSKNTEEKVGAIHRYLGGQCRYSSRVEKCPADRNPVEYFIFDVRAGHCEYFATAEAIMLRYAKVPTRLVNGFTRGEINPLTNSLVVRQLHAHSWVDYYDPLLGWLEDDPTPPQLEEEPFSMFRWMSRMGETIEFFWISRVINYEASDQIRIFRNFRMTVGQWRNTMIQWFRGRGMKDYFGQTADWFKSLKIQKYYADKGLFPYFGLLVPIIGVLLLLLLFRHRRREIDKNRPDRISLEYARFLKKAARAGVVRSPWETPWEFSKRLDGIFPSHHVQSITDLFCRLRYVPTSEPGVLVQETEIICRMISTLKQLPRKVRRRHAIQYGENAQSDKQSETKRFPRHEGNHPPQG